MTYSSFNIRRTPTRDHNDLKDCGEYFIKSSSDIAKIEAEARFYEELPTSLTRYFPKYLGRSEQGRWPSGYMIHKIPASDSSLFRVGLIEADANYFENLIQLLQEFLSAEPKKNVTLDDWMSHIETSVIGRDLGRHKLLHEKSVLGRLEKIYLQAGWNSAEAFLGDLHSRIRTQARLVTTPQLWLSHGDLCLSNIIIHNSKLFLIDPRGLATEPNDSYLVPHYDFAKLSQCLLGNYDFINHELKSPLAVPIAEVSFARLLSDFNIDHKLVALIESSHFFAMTPIHANHPDKITAFAESSIKAFNRAVRL